VRVKTGLSGHEVSLALDIYPPAEHGRVLAADGVFLTDGQRTDRRIGNSNSIPVLSRTPADRGAQRVGASHADLRFCGIFALGLAR